MSGDFEQKATKVRKGSFADLRGVERTELKPQRRWIISTQAVYEPEEGVEVLCAAHRPGR